MHVSDDLRIPAENTASHSGAVSMASALRPVKVQTNPTALVAEKFLAFASQDLTQQTPTDTVTVGSVEVEVVTGYLNAADGSAVTMLDQMIELGSTSDAVTDEQTSVMFIGDFSFASRAWLDDMADCSDDESDLRMDPGEDEDMMRDTTRLKPQSLAYVNENKNLCIMVRGKDDPMAVAIPATTAYMVAKTIVLIDTLSASKFPPMPAPAPLGAIMRDGTTVHIPYITQFADYNQRIVIVNRGAEAAYTFSFMTEDGVTTTPGADAEGMLAANSTTYLSLKYGDLVTIEGPFNRASASLIVESQPGYIDVVVSQTNVNGGTDTVKYTPN